MLNPKDIENYSSLSKSQKLDLEKQMQQDDLHYLSSVAFEQFGVSDADIKKLHQGIDKRTSFNSNSFQAIFISVLCGLLIGVSIFFVIFQKSKNHPSIFQSLFEESATSKSLNNTIQSVDTLFPAIETKAVPIEHYKTIAEQAEEPTISEVPDMLSTIPSTLSEINNEENNDIILRFIPNAPVIFIHQLKVTNYRFYYFKQSQAIDLSINSGLSAQYESNTDVEFVRLNRSNAYLAHKIIRNAMGLFNSKRYANCIEELNLLYNFNPDDANAQFYLGMCYYLTGKYTLAQTFFLKNVDNQNNIFHQESEFYQALCLLNTQQTDKALEQLQQIVNRKGFYGTRAQEVLNKQTK
jgi:tetratricopeptide (TPR) repeat protein